jgi:hypothetical protein
LFAAVGAVAIGLGFLIGATPFQDNSFFTHLATGRSIVDTGSIPHQDPYSFTAPGTGWVVQSWLASLALGLADSLGGAFGIRLLVGSVAAALAGLCWHLIEPAGTLLPRVGLMALMVLVGAGYWAGRPLVFGLVGLALTLTVTEGHLSARWLVPVYWLWANSHGSFPLGLLALVVLAGGRRLDAGAAPLELRALGWAALGTGAAVANPFGIGLLLFPVRLLARREALEPVREWQPPRFDNVSQWAFLALVAGAALGLVRRPSWRQGLTFAVFVTAALLGARNIPVASLVLLPGLAASLSGVGSIDGSGRRVVHLAIGVAMVALSVTVVALQEDYALRTYPVDSVSYLEAQGLVPEGRVVAPDFVGNYLELRYGDEASVFIDDRYDMFPVDIVEDHRVFLDGRPGWQEVLGRWNPSAVLWQTNSPLGQLLLASPDWQVVFAEPEWAVVRRR